MELSVAAAQVLGRGDGVRDGRSPSSGAIHGPLVSSSRRRWSAGWRRLESTYAGWACWRVAYLAADDADFGVMLSASHNPMPDNGIKFFARGGRKLDDEVEEAIERALGEQRRLPVGGDVGRVVDDLTAADRYVAHLVGTVTQPLTGLKIVVDCAEGAAFDVAGVRWVEQGRPSMPRMGWNINANCGSTSLASLQTAVQAAGADAGFALDGDADGAGRGRQRRCRRR